MEPQAADLNEGYFFLAYEAFFQSQRRRWFLLRGGFMDKNDRSSIVCCTLQLVMNKYCLNRKKKFNSNKIVSVFYILSF